MAFEHCRATPATRRREDLRRDRACTLTLCRITLLASATRSWTAPPEFSDLNPLIRKQPRGAVVYPTDAGLRSSRAPSRPPFDWVFLVAAVKLTTAERARVNQIARLAVRGVDGDSLRIMDFAEASAKRIRSDGLRES